MSVISSSLRKEYTQSKLMETDLESNPFDQFHKWFNDAVSAELPLPNAMTLATVKQDQTPAARVVLLKELDQRGLFFIPTIRVQKLKSWNTKTKPPWFSGGSVKNARFASKVSRKK